MGIKNRIIKHYFCVYRRGTLNFENSIIMINYSPSPNILKEGLFSFKAVNWS